jgi:hypothetical protein
MRIDWAARAAIVLENQPPKVTDKTDETRQPDSSGRLSSVSSVPSGQAFSKSQDSGGANQWRAYFKSGAIREVSFAPARSATEVAAHCPDAIALVEVSSTIPSCKLCRHTTKHGNCGQPVEAGLSGHFVLIKHPNAGADCPHFTSLNCSHQTQRNHEHGV